MEGILIVDLERLKYLAAEGDIAARQQLARESTRRGVADDLSLDWLRGDAAPALELGSLYPEAVFPEDLRGVPSDLATVLWRLTVGEKTILTPPRSRRDTNIVRVTRRRREAGGFRLSVQHKRTTFAERELQRITVQLGVWPHGGNQICKGYTFRPGKNHQWGTTVRFVGRCWRGIMGYTLDAEDWNHEAEPI